MDEKEFLADAFARAIRRQPWLLRRKESILQILQGVAWVLATFFAQSGTVDTWQAIAIGAASSLVAFLITAFTKAAVTPSMVDRVASEVYKVEDLPVVNFASSGL